MNMNIKYPLMWSKIEQWAHQNLVMALRILISKTKAIQLLISLYTQEVIKIHK